ncbi:MAG TPA: hypothetical protein VJZ70_02385 [Limnochordia bacterium]|jgi:peptidoglycan/LPS O-acetylase OafA/YrhL|nr:hypothetical protein [Limnochordia bacterium]
MVGVIILGFMLIGGIELYLWPQRAWKEVSVYVVLLGGVTALAVLIYLIPDLPVPTPFGFVWEMLMKLWQGGGS